MPAGTAICGPRYMGHVGKGSALPPSDAPACWWPSANANCSQQSCALQQSPTVVHPSQLLGNRLSGPELGLALPLLFCISAQTSFFPTPIITYFHSGIFKSVSWKYQIPTLKLKIKILCIIPISCSNKVVSNQTV